MPLSDIPDMDWGRIQNAVLWVENHTRGTNQRLPGEGSPVPYQFRRFRLTEDLQEGSSAGAVHLRWDGDAAFLEGEAFTVWDLVDNYVGEVGDEGWAIHPHDLDRWEIVELRQIGGRGSDASIINGQTTGTVATTDETFTIDGVVVLQPEDGTIASGNITINNRVSFETDSGGECYAVWNYSAGTWDCIQLECPA